MIDEKDKKYFAEYIVPLDNKDKNYIDDKCKINNFTKVINNYLEEIDSAKRAEEGKIVYGTIHYYYKTVISYILYILDRYCDDEFIYDTFVDLLQNVHLSNIDYEKRNPPVIYKKKQSKEVVEKKTKKIYDKEEDTKYRLKQLVSLDLSNIKLKIKL
jgi:hypothetical protein